jgi:predicted ester cyclase
VQEIVVEGDRIAARRIDTGTPVAEWNGPTPTGARVEFAETAFYQLEDGHLRNM